MLGVLVLVVGLLFVLPGIWGWMIWLGLHPKERTIWRNGQIEWRFPELHMGELPEEKHVDEGLIIFGIFGFLLTGGLIWFSVVSLWPHQGF